MSSLQCVMQEIQQYVQKETAGASKTDPFEVRLHSLSYNA